jgi:threonylcarbamoyladenosine tRNA methylthiotransferase MtaB
MPNQVPVQIARHRNQVLRELAAEKNLAFRRSHIGKTVRAITLKAGDFARSEAITENYLKLELEGRHEANRWISARIHGVTAQGLTGTYQPSF